MTAFVIHASIVDRFVQSCCIAIAIFGFVLTNRSIGSGKVTAMSVLAIPGADYSDTAVQRNSVRVPSVSQNCWAVITWDLLDSVRSPLMVCDNLVLAGGVARDCSLFRMKTMLQL